MNKSDIIKNLSSKTEPTNVDTLAMVECIINFISESLAQENRVELRNFGTFSIRNRDQRISRNPKTGSAVLVAAKNHPYFRPSKLLKESLNK